MFMQIPHERTRIRDLAKALRARWSAYSSGKFKRSELFASRKRVVNVMSFVVDFVGAVRSKRIDVDTISRGEFEEAIQELVEKHGH